MNNPQQTDYRARRATTEDLGALVELWKLMRFPVEELSRRVTDFQIVEDASGKLLGAVAIEVTDRQARLHSEGFVDFSMSDSIRAVLWNRIETLAGNRSLLNIWTQEQAPFWKHTGFAEPGPELMKQFPRQWSSQSRWLVIKLREDVEAILVADKEFAAFMQTEKARTQRTLQRAKALKLVATLIAIALFILVIIGGYFLIRHNSPIR